MKRFLGVLVAVLALAGLTLFHGTTAAGPSPDKKQMVCHVDSVGAAHLIYISNNAVPAHLQNHDDCLVNSEDQSLVGQPCNPTDANNDDICDIQP